MSRIILFILKKHLTNKYRGVILVFMRLIEGSNLEIKQTKTSPGVR
jgi:hypothetical protein